MDSTDSVDVRNPRTPPSTTTFSPGASKSRWWAWPLTLLILGGGGYELYQTVGKQ